MRSESGNDMSERSVIDIQNSSPQNLFEAESLCLMLINVVVKQGGNHVVGGCNRVEVSGEVEIDLFHRQDLCVSSAGSASLHSEARSE